jgi:hypothetical protein
MQGEQPNSERGSVAEKDVSDFCGYPVHKAADVFRLLEGKAWDEFLEDIRAKGVLEPVRLYKGEIVDGRNRSRAVSQLLKEGVQIELKTVDWEPQKGETVYEAVLSWNLHRRHLTDDQRAFAVVQMDEVIRSENAARQKASQYKREQKESQDGNEGAADLDADPPEDQANGDKNSRSTIGRLAAAGGVSRHKVHLASRVRDLGSDDDKKVVAAGHEKLSTVAKKLPKQTPKKTKKEPSVEEVATDAWERLKQKVPITEHFQLRTVMQRIIQSELLAFEGPKRQPKRHLSPSADDGKHSDGNIACLPQEPTAHGGIEVPPCL